MPRLIRISLIAILLLLSLISLPFWSRGLKITDQGSTEKLTTAVADPPTKTNKLRSKLSKPSAVALELPKITLVDAGWVTGNSTKQQVVRPPSILHWDPAQTAVDWRLETGSFTGAYMDDEGRIYLMEQHILTILDEQSGEVLIRKQLKDMPESGPNAGQPIPVAQQGNRLYLRNYDLDNNLFVYDLQRGVFDEERWTLCEGGYPFDSVYLTRKNAFVTFCIDFYTGIQGILTRLSIDDETSASVEIPVLGAEEYMVGNGFALGPDDKAYVVDSDAGALVEIDIDSMQILRQANYRRTNKERGRLPRSLSWLFDLAASPARAKRWMSQPAISPDGSYLVVDGGFGVGGGETTSAWLISLENLEPVEEIKLPRSPQAFHFANNYLLYILLETEMPGASQVMVFDLDNQQSRILDVPSPGRVLQILH